MRTNLIVARSKDNVIGKAGKIPWKIKGEQSQFKELTTGNAVIMGRSTYEEIGKPLPGRMNIVVSTTKTFEGENLITVPSLSEALKKAKELDYKEAFIAGGQRLYAEAVHFVDRMFITEIDMDFSKGGHEDLRYFVHFNPDDFIYSEGELEGDLYKYRRTLYVRRPRKGTIFHKYITVNDDEQKKEKFDGTLADYAARKLSLWKMSEADTARVISIESTVWTDNIRPVQCNSGTWYDRRTMQLSVWLEA